MEHILDKRQTDAPQTNWQNIGNPCVPPMDLHQEAPQKTLRGGGSLRHLASHETPDSDGVGNAPPIEEQESARHIPEVLNNLQGEATSSEALNANWNGSSEVEEQGDCGEEETDAPYNLEGVNGESNNGDAPEINWSPPLQPCQEIRAPIPDNGSSDLYQRAQQEGFGSLAGTSISTQRTRLVPFETNHRRPPLIRREF